jgi:hypothetical protein
MITTITLADAQVATSGIQPIDLAAFLALALVWIFVLAMLYAIFKVLRSKARGDAGWGDSPGL